MLLVLASALGTGQAQPKPNEPASPGWIAKPNFTAPAPYQKFTNTATLVIDLQANIPNVQTGYTIPGPFDFVAYAKTSPFTEKWHIQLVKQGPSGGEIALQSFEGMVNGYQFGISLNADWFKAKGGPGKYAARAYISQQTPQGKVTGLATGVGFELIEPLRAVDQNKPGNVMAVPPKFPPPVETQPRR